MSCQILLRSITFQHVVLRYNTLYNLVKEVCQQQIRDSFWSLCLLYWEVLQGMSQKEVLYCSQRQLLLYFYFYSSFWYLLMLNSLQTSLSSFLQSSTRFLINQKYLLVMLRSYYIRTKKKWNWKCFQSLCNIQV